MPDPQSGDGESRLSKAGVGLDQSCETLRWSSNTGIAVCLLIVFTYEFADIANVVTFAYSFITNLH